MLDLGPDFVEEAPSSTRPEPRVGDWLGPYYLQEQVGQGGMGRVFRAVHEKLGRRVAIKLMRRSVSEQGGSRRFLREARVVNRIRHPHLIEVTDIVEALPGGDSYYVMEWLDGKDLHARMRECGGRLPMKEILSTMLQVAETLEAVHQAGVVHCDLKPDNIFLIERGGRRDFVKLIDFGVALDTSEPNPDPDETVMGTPIYCAPEQREGGPMDARVDIYAFGLILYELATGQLPERTNTAESTIEVQLGAGARRCAAPPWCAHHAMIPEGLRRIIARCTAEEPAQRYPSMAEVIAELRALSGRPLLSHWRRPRWLLLGGAAAATLAALCAAGLDQRAAIWHASLRLAAPLHARLWPPPPAPPAPPAPLPLEVEIETRPPGAEVRYGGKVLGRTPCIVRLPEGRRAVELYRPGYRVLRQIIDVRVGVQLSARLTR